MKTLTDIESELIKSLNDDENILLEKFADAQEQISSVAIYAEN